MRFLELTPQTSIEIEEGTDLENEAGACVWDAAISLIYFLVLHKGLITPEHRVIDVGSGTGAVGLAAAALGAHSVTLTDLPHLKHLIDANITRNSLAQRVSFFPLNWGDPLDTALAPPFDLVLASDVLYQQEWVDPLIQTLKSLSGPSTRIFLANEHRSKLPFPAHRFLSSGFEVQEVPYDQLHPEWRSTDIQIYNLKLILNS